jgi:hypothetical protein
MAKDRHNQGGPTVSPKDQPTPDRDNERQTERSAQSQSAPIGDEERDNREGAGESRRNGSQSNPS